MVGVRTSIFGRPRPLPSHRRATRYVDPPYTLIREEPVKSSRRRSRLRTRGSWSSVPTVPAGSAHLPEAGQSGARLLPEPVGSIVSRRNGVFVIHEGRTAPLGIC